MPLNVMDQVSWTTTTTTTTTTGGGGLRGIRLLLGIGVLRGRHGLHAAAMGASKNLGWGLRGINKQRNP